MNRSSAPVSDRLREHLRKLVDDIGREFASTLHSGSPEAVAAARELFLAEILSRFLPRTYDIAKGKIYDSMGGVSDSIDLVVLGKNHPKFRNASGQIELLLADGVHAAIELKPDLSDLPALHSNRKQKPEIWRALEQARSVKRLRRIKPPLLDRFADEDLRSHSLTVPFYIVTAKAASALELATYVDAYYDHHQIAPEDQFDALIILDHGVLVNTKYKRHFLRPQENGAATTALLAFDTSNSLVEFLFLLMIEIPPEPNITAPFLPTYLRSLLEGRLAGAFTFNPRSS